MSNKNSSHELSDSAIWNITVQIFIFHVPILELFGSSKITEKPYKNMAAKCRSMKIIRRKLFTFDILVMQID